MVDQDRPIHISNEAHGLLRVYEWPGDVRELENVIERAVVLRGPEGAIEARRPPAWLQGQSLKKEPKTLRCGRRFFGKKADRRGLKKKPGATRP